MGPIKKAVVFMTGYIWHNSKLPTVYDTQKTGVSSKPKVILSRTALNKSIFSSFTALNPLDAAVWYRMGPPSDVCCLTTPSKYSYCYRI